MPRDKETGEDSGRGGSEGDNKIQEAEGRSGDNGIQAEEGVQVVVEGWGEGTVVKGGYHLRVDVIGDDDGVGVGLQQSGVDAARAKEGVGDAAHAGEVDEL